MTMIIEELDWQIDADEWADAEPRCPRKDSEELAAMVAEYLAAGGAITYCEPTQIHSFTHRETLNALFDAKNTAWSLKDTFTLEERAAHQKRKHDRLRKTRMAEDKNDVPKLDAALNIGFINRSALVTHLGMSNDKVCRLLAVYFAEDPRAEGMQRVDRDTKKSQQDAKWVARIKEEFDKGDIKHKTDLRKRVGGGITDPTITRILRAHFANHPITIELREGGKVWSPTWLRRQTEKAEKLLAAGKNGRKELGAALRLETADDIDHFLRLTGLPFVNKRRIGLRGTTA